jgi:hypothetical protein
MICSNIKCNKEFDPKVYNQKYCCPKCANNTQKVRDWIDKNRKKCPTCDSKIRHTSKHCSRCSKIHRSVIPGTTKLGVYRNLISVKNGHASWKNVHIRQFARSRNKDLREQACQNCGYKLHIELAHIKPISSFSDDATIDDVNSRSNLLVLCRNCHWEFDNGYIKIGPEGFEPPT